jgi:hypothetical protein
MSKRLAPLPDVHTMSYLVFLTLLCEYVRDVHYIDLSVTMVGWYGELQTGVHRNCSVNYLIVSACPFSHQSNTCSTVLTVCFESLVVSHYFCCVLSL